MRDVSTAYFDLDYLPFIEDKKELIGILTSSLCISFIFLVFSVTGEWITTLSSILFSFLFALISYLNLIMGKMYRQAIGYTADVLEEEGE